MADPLIPGAAAVSAPPARAVRMPGLSSARLPILAWIVLAILIGVPVARLLGVALGQGPASVLATLAESRVRDPIVNSAWTAGLAAAIAVVVGVAAALATERAGLPRRGWLRAGILLPLVCPPFVAAFGWARAYGPRGLTDQAMGIAIPGLYGPVGIVILLAVSAVPLTWLIVAGALAVRVDPDTERAARASGAGPWTTTRTITLPLLRAPVLSAAIVAFVFSINAFGIPAVLGTPAGFTTITTRLYQDLARSSDPALFREAAVLAATLVVLALAVVGPADRWLTGRSAARTGGSQTANGAVAGSGLARTALAVLVGAIIVVVAIVPLVAVLLTALTKAVGLAPVPANWTLANFATALDPRFVDGLARSLVLASVAATVVVILGGLLASLGRRHGLLRTSATLGFALPGSALAIAILLAYGGWLRDSLAIILLAYLAKFWALGHRQMAGSADRLPPDLVRAARASGAGAVTSVRSIVLPILRPSVVAAWLMVFLFALHELTMSSLLYGPRTATLSVVVLDAQQLGDPTVTAALAVLLIGVVAIVAIPLALVARRR